MWTLGKPVEQVILDNEEKTTTYAETGETGLLLGEVSLPTPKNQQIIAFLIHTTAETKTDGVSGSVGIRLFDGTTEMNVDGHVIDGLTYLFSHLSGVYSSADDTTTNLKGNTQLKVRIYLVGVSGAPTVAQYCRNLVVTVVPLYKT